MTRHGITLGLAAAMVLATVGCIEPEDESAYQLSQDLNEFPNAPGEGGGGDGVGGGGGDDPSGQGGAGAGGGDDDDGEADLPYNVDLQLGDTFQLTDAFLMKGAAPAAVLELTMSAPQWRLVELQNDTPYVVNQDDCDHEGNHGTGRDRYEITWENQDGTTESDHFTVRYCD